MELRTKFLMVKAFSAFDLAALFDGFQTLRVLGQKVRVDHDFLAGEGRKIEEHPEIRLGVSQLDLELAFGASIHEQAEAAFGRAILDGQVQVAPLRLEFALDVGEQDWQPAVGLDDLIDVDMPPAASGLIDDLQ